MSVASICERSHHAAISTLVRGGSLPLVVGARYLSASRTQTVISQIFACAVALVFAVGCASKPQREALPPEPVRPLSELVQRKVIVLPAAALRTADALGWAALAIPSRAYLAKLDDEIAFALGERGIKAPQWIFPPDLARSAKRNPTFLVDPYTLRPADMLRMAERDRDQPLMEPLSSQLRGLAGVHDARFALIPAEVRFERVPNASGGRAMLYVVLVDVRRSAVQWRGIIASDLAESFSPALAASLASHLADLIIAP